MSRKSETLYDINSGEYIINKKFLRVFTFGRKILTPPLLILLLCGCHTVGPLQEYSDPKNPRFSSVNKDRLKGSIAQTIKVVSYNIKFSEKINQAIKILRKNQELFNAEFVFLQEMNHEGVRKIADELDYNYIYYPTKQHPFHGKDFGNAILSKWKFINDEKIIFGHSKYVKRQRVAIRAEVERKEQIIQLIGVHMHVKIEPEERAKRLQELVEKSNQGSQYCIIAGDFNTYWESELKAVKQALFDANFKLASDREGWTFRHWIFLNKKYYLDHIFAREFNPIKSGTVKDQTASDHIPIWAELSL
jgi:endonuclease/exonuclease/phosphatase family metal-dependent hydrolase